MGLLRVADADLTTIQHRGFCHFASSTERTQQLPTPELGTVSVIGLVYECWNGAAWVRFPP